MAYSDKDNHFPILWADLLGEDALAGSYLEFFDPETHPGGFDPPGMVRHGYIIRDWFGPFLLGPLSGPLPGQC